MISRFLRTHRAIYGDRDRVYHAAIGEDRGLSSPWLVLGVGILLLGALDLWLFGGAPLLDDAVTAWLPWRLLLPQLVAWLVLSAITIGVMAAFRTSAQPRAIVRLWAYAVGHVSTVLAPLAAIFAEVRSRLEGVPAELAGVGVVLLISLATAAWLAAGLRRMAQGRWLPAILSVVIAYLGSGALTELRQQLVARSFSIQGGSMFPAFHPGDVVLANRLMLATRGPKAGDIVVYAIKPTRESPEGGHYVHRVVATAGQTVRFTDCAVVVDGRVARTGEQEPAPAGRDEAYSGVRWRAPESLGGRTIVTAFSNARDNICQMAEVRVPAGHVFVAGDHRDSAVDSRQPWHGFVAHESVTGVVVFRHLPRERRGRP
jgi:signal peptidase I